MHMSKRKEIPQIIFFAQPSRFARHIRAADLGSGSPAIQVEENPRTMRSHHPSPLPLPSPPPGSSLYSHYFRQCYKVGRRAHKFSFHSGSFLRHATAVSVWYRRRDCVSFFSVLAPLEDFAVAFLRNNSYVCVWVCVCAHADVPSFFLLYLCGTSSDSLSAAIFISIKLNSAPSPARKETGISVQPGADSLEPIERGSYHHGRVIRG